MGPTTTKRRAHRPGTVAAIAVAILVGTTALAGCGSDGPTAGPTTAPPDSRSTDTPTGSDTTAADDRATTTTAPACTTTTGPVTRTYAEVPGVDPDLLSLDLYPRPEGCGPAPVLFWVHGGGWRTGDKANEGVATKADWAAEHGWTLVAVNYRLSTDGSGVVWPTHGEDVATAVAWTLDHADELGVDPQRVAVVGHSAGAHIASMVAVDPTLLGPVGRDRTDVDCLVALDTEGYDVQQRVDTGGEATDAMYGAAFGTDPAALAAASPLQVLRREGGPVADAVIVTRGLPTRRAQAEAFAAELRAAGSQVEVVTAGGYSHADVNHQLGVAGETVETPPITAFLERCLG